MDQLKQQPRRRGANGGGRRVYALLRAQVADGTLVPGAVSYTHLDVYKRQKFTRDGVVTLSVTATRNEDTCVLHFAVSDTGIGIDLNQGVDIFGAFQQIQAASGGTGLGLFIAQRILSALSLIHI